jgi:hypothetical protein
MMFDMPQDEPFDREEYEAWEAASDEIDDLTDAIIEDTVHCDMCGAMWVLGGNDGLVINSPVKDIREFLGIAQLKLCCECIDYIARCCRDFVLERDVCEHGIMNGDLCIDCNAAYTQARIDNDT